MPEHDDPYELLRRTQQNMLAATGRPLDSRTLTDICQGLHDVAKITEALLKHAEGKA